MILRAAAVSVSKLPTVTQVCPLSAVFKCHIEPLHLSRTIRGRAGQSKEREDAAEQYNIALGLAGLCVSPVFEP